MNWEAIGAIGETIGAIAVIISLLYLAIQIRQNTAQMKHSAELARLSLQENFVSGQQTFFMTLLTSSNAFDVWKSASANAEELDDDEREKVGLLFYDQMYRYQVMYQARVIDPQETDRLSVQLDRIAHLPSFEGWWTRQRDAFDYDPPFVQLVDAHITRISNDV